MLVNDDKVDNEYWLMTMRLTMSASYGTGILPEELIESIHEITDDIVGLRREPFLESPISDKDYNGLLNEIILLIENYIHNLKEIKDGN